MKKEAKKELEKLSKSDKEKFIVFSRMRKVKIAMIIFLILGAPVFVFGILKKTVIAIIVGAAFLTLFVILEIVREYLNSIWNKLLREERKKKK